MEEGMTFIIKECDSLLCEELASIIREANESVAVKFNLNLENNPKHPSFCTREWVLQGMEKGEKYFIFQEKDEYKGCAAFQRGDARTAYLNRLAVLPSAQKNGIGEKLVKHIIDYSKLNNFKYISIGIISDHAELKKWYEKLGFVEKEVVEFDYLPFKVCMMRYYI